MADSCIRPRKPPRRRHEPSRRGRRVTRAPLGAPCPRRRATRRAERNCRLAMAVRRRGQRPRPWIAPMNPQVTQRGSRSSVATRSLCTLCGDSVRHAPRQWSWASLPTWCSRRERHLGCRFYLPVADCYRARPRPYDGGQVRVGDRLGPGLRGSPRESTARSCASTRSSARTHSAKHLRQRGRYGIRRGMEYPTRRPGPPAT